MSFGVPLGSSFFKDSNRSTISATRVGQTGTKSKIHYGDIIDEKNLDKCLNCTLPKCTNCVSRKKAETYGKERRLYNSKKKETVLFMSSLYTINKKIEDILGGKIDPETGEVMFNENAFEELEALGFEKNEKLEAIALDQKNARVMVDGFTKEIKALQARRAAWERRAENDERLLSEELNGEKFETSKVVVSFKKTPASVEVDDGFIDWAQSNNDALLRYKSPEVNKDAVKSLLKSGQTLPFARLVQRVTMSIK